jgi:undecaprenyl phosphate N,N'-diacetylbacillosamine 1-phosphate transferase
VLFDGFPVLFTQDRPGFHEKIFKIFKFRTMKTQKNGENLPDHQRMTKIGSFMRKTSLDELPQLFNVIKGELSLVGPRPLLVEYLPLYNNKQKKRHLVKPGITGWAQVNGRNAISWEQKFDYDVWYVENWSLALDLKILALTFFKVIKRSGVNASSEITMEKFKGSSK